MSVSRIVLAFGIIVSLSFVGCGSAVVPNPSSTPVQPGDSTPTASTPALASGQSGAPSPSKSLESSGPAAVWLHAGDLGEARNATNVVMVGTGEVLVVGSNWQTSWLATCGTATGGSDSVELGDPETGAWEKTTSLPNRRERPVVVALPDGRALLTGGETGEEGGPSAYSSTFVFDPADRSWTPSGVLNTARTGTAAAVLADGRVLVAGGLYIDRAGQRDLDSSELWDPTSGKWSRTGPLAGTRIGASAVTLADGRVLLVGGVMSNAEQIQQVSAEIYDPESGRWSSAGTLARARSGFALIALRDGGAIVAGGFGGLGTAASSRLSTVERFDPVSNTWSLGDDLPGPVAGASGIRLADGRVLLAGGSARDPEPIDADTGTYVSGLTADAALFDPETGRWTPTTPMPSPRAGASAVLLADGSAVLVGGSASERPGTPGCPDADPRVFRYLPGS